MRRTTGLSFGALNNLLNRVLQTVQFAVQRVLFFARQTAAMLGRHVTRFLTHYIQPMMERFALWRRVKALAYALINVMPKRVDSPVHLIHPMHRFHMRIGARRCFLDDIDLARRLDDTRRERSRERHADQRAGKTCFKRQH
jgi:hypothetical protein